jgi:site-specific DNA-methyltransferase (adenine-specific)
LNLKLKKIELNKIYNQNCIEGMKLIPKNKIDLVITDPPFAINFKAKKANYNRTSSRVLSGYNEIQPEDYYDFTFNWMSEVFRILKDSGSMYIFSGWNNLKDILRAIDDVGFTTVNHVIWKYQFGVVTKRKFVTSHYHCLYVCKDDKKRKFFPFSRFKKDEKTKDGQKMVGVFIIETRKMSGTSKENIGQVMKKPRPNFLQKLLKNYWSIQVKKMI